MKEKSPRKLKKAESFWRGKCLSAAGFFGLPKPDEGFTIHRVLAPLAFAFRSRLAIFLPAIHLDNH
jgi:hypothetical protein